MAKDNTIIWDAGKLKQARETANLELETAADYLKIHKGYLYMLEVGKRQPSPRVLNRISKLYRRPLADFLVDQKNFVSA